MNAMNTETAGSQGALGTRAAPAPAAAPQGAEKPKISSDFETFLRMLTVQMQNQDPLNPIQSSDFAVQLATFSGVEQQVRTNDLLEKRKKLKKKELVRIREVARLRFATEFAPDAFAPYLKSDRKGRYKVVRLHFGADGLPTGDVEPLLEYSGAGDRGTGWPHRPVGLATAPDGKVLVSSDASDSILAVGYDGT